MSNNVLVENLSGAEKDLITRLTDTIAFLKSLTRPQDVDERCSNTLSKLALELSDRARKFASPTPLMPLIFRQRNGAIYAKSNDSMLCK